MNNKFENENGKEKLFKKRLLDRTPKKNTGLNFCLSLYQKPCNHICDMFFRSKSMAPTNFKVTAAEKKVRGQVIFKLFFVLPSSINKYINNYSVVQEVTSFT